MSTRVFKQSSRSGRDVTNKKNESILSNTTTTLTQTTPTQDEDILVHSRGNVNNERAKSPIATGNSNYDQSGFVTYFPKNAIIMKPKLDDPNVLHKKKVVFAKSDKKCNENITPITVEVIIEKDRIDAEVKASVEIEHRNEKKRVPWKQLKKVFYEQKSIYSHNEISHLDSLKDELSDDFFNDERNWTYEFTLDFANEIDHHYKSRRFFPKVPYDKKSISIFTEPADVVVSVEKLNKLKFDLQNHTASHNKPAVKLSDRQILGGNFSNVDKSFDKKVDAPSVPILQRQKSSMGVSLGGRNFDFLRD